VIKTDFIFYMNELGIKLTDTQIKQFETYILLLQEWNQKINLTTIIETNDIYLKHFYDSATLVKGVDFNNVSNVCDVGTGAGFPGLVIKILYPNIKLTLVDSLNKRILFLNEVISQLKLNQVECVHDRAELFGKKRRNEFDIVTSRAVSKLNTLLEYCIPLTKVGGMFIAMKANLNQELEESKNALINLDCVIKKIETFDLPTEAGVRNLIFVEKTKDTNLLYPRENKEIKDKPL